MGKRCIKIVPCSVQGLVWDHPCPRRLEKVTAKPHGHACTVGEERAKAQEGDFYGGWITSQIAGPLEGESAASADRPNNLRTATG